jgi:hypothetical protein
LRDRLRLAWGIRFMGSPENKVVCCVDKISRKVRFGEFFQRDPGVGNRAWIGQRYEPC